MYLPVKVEIKFHLECRLHFPCAQLMLRQMHWTNASKSIEAKYWVSWVSFDFNKCEYELSKLPLNSSFCAVTADSKLRWPHSEKAFFRGVVVTRSPRTNSWRFARSPTERKRNCAHSPAGCRIRDLRWRKRKRNRQLNKQHHKTSLASV